MRPISVRLAAVGNSAWLQLNRVAQSYWTSLGVSLSSGANLTYSVQHTTDDIHERFTEFSITRSTTTATIKLAGHGLSVNDWVMGVGIGAPFEGEFAVASVSDADTLTITVADAGLSARVNGALHKARVVTHDILAGKQVSAESNYSFSPIACRLAVTAHTAGTADLKVVQGRG